ncbi:MAG: hypothetical protein L0Z55_07605 [Planctomycetes bacterium]|nr:hypothetical protein [Planctomycetota bacterium]
MKEGQWEISFAYRYQFSNRHFEGDHEQKQRIHGHNDVRNRQNIWDVSLTRAVSNRTTISVSIPLVFNERSQRNNAVNRRIYTHASGIGDIIITPRYWVCDPAGNPKGNMQLSASASSCRPGSPMPRIRSSTTPGTGSCARSINRSNPATADSDSCSMSSGSTISAK